MDAPAEWRVVVDTNVFVSAVITGGTSRRVLDLGVAGRIRVIASPLLLDELRRVLAREHFLRWRSRQDLDQFLVDISAIARAAEADAICSGDGDLADVAGIEVLAPAALLRRFIEHD